MTIRDNSNRGALFKNTEKEVSTHPDYKGTANISGQEFWLDAWVNQSKAGTKYLSLRFKPKNSLAKPDFDDSIPF